jgi:hypothetical protein
MTIARNLITASVALALCAAQSAALAREMPIPGAPGADVRAEDSEVKPTYLCKSRTDVFIGTWSPVSKECQYTSPAHGWKGKIFVAWSANPGANQTACMQARMGKATKPKEKWQSLGCGPKGGGWVRWPKNTASRLEVRGESTLSIVANIEYFI